MVSTVEEDFDLFRELVREHLEDRSRVAGAERIQRTTLYKRFHSLTYFEQSFPSDEARRDYLASLEEAKRSWNDAKEHLERTLLPTFLNPETTTRHKR